MNTQSLSDVKNRAIEIVKSQAFKRQAISFAVTVATVVAVRVVAGAIAEAIENKIEANRQAETDILPETVLDEETPAEVL